MATVNGITAEKMQELADAFIVDGEVDLAGHLILTKAGGGTVDAGNVKGDDGLQGEPGIAGGYQLGAIGIWMSAVEPSWGKFLNGQTIVGGATTYSGLAALYPSWVSGANLVLPDWGTRTPVGYKAGDDTFFTLGAMMGAKTHTLTVQELPDHAHGSPGAAGATASGTADVKARGLSPGDTSFRTSASIYATGTYGSTVISGSRAHNNIQPSVVVNWVVCVATSSGDFDTEVQTALVSRVSALEAINATTKPAFQAVSAADQTKSGAASSVKINFATEELDMASNYDPTTSRFTAPVDGVYQITGVFSATNTTTGPEIELFKNGSVFYNNVAIGYTTAYMSFGFSVLLDLNAGDYIELYLTNNNGVTTTLSGGRCRFSGHLIS